MTSSIASSYVPDGFAHGFCVVSEIADVTYKVSTYYDPGAESGFAYDDPAVGIDWPDPAISSYPPVTAKRPRWPRSRSRSPSATRNAPLASLTPHMTLGSSSPALRGAVIGLGMIGRHHARLLQASERVEFVGAVDGEGDRYGSVHDRGLVFGSVAELLERRSARPLDFAIVAVPTDAHLPVARELMSAGVSVLVEKPLAGTVEAAEEIMELCESNQVYGAVGHVERYNVALQEMRRRVVDGQLGRLFALSAIRSGPFAGRVRDVGVVKDLATHDIDVDELAV